MKYLHWNETTISDLSESNISAMYEQGYVFTRKGKGVMQQTRSVRINLAKFSLTSENRRILKKTEGFMLSAGQSPIADYTFEIGKLAKDFYDSKFGPGIMSAQKVKEMLTDEEKSNFNVVLRYSASGYAICYMNETLLHYSYPFYDLSAAPKDMGLGMMIRAIEHARSAGLKYIYLGSLQRPGDVYKMQFDGLEWFDGKDWSRDIEKAKMEIRQA